MITLVFVWHMEWYNQLSSPAYSKVEGQWRERAEDYCHFFTDGSLKWIQTDFKNEEELFFLPSELLKSHFFFYVWECTARPVLIFFFLSFSHHSHRMAQRICTCMTYLWYYHHHDWSILIILLWWCTVKPIVLFTHRRRWCFHMEQVAYIHFHCIWWGSCGCLLWMFCSLIGDWFQFLVPIQSFPSDSHSRFYVVFCQTPPCWRGADAKILDPEHIVWPSD